MFGQTDVNNRKRKTFVVAAAAASAAVALTASSSLQAQAAHRSLQYLTVNVGKFGSYVNGVNDAGVMTGTYLDAGGGYHGYVMSGGRVVKFDYPGTSGVTFPSGINNTNTVAGAYIDANGIWHGFVRRPGGAFSVINDPKVGSGGAGHDS